LKLTSRGLGGLLLGQGLEALDEVASVGEHRADVRLLDDEVLVALNLEFGPGVAGEQNLHADLHSRRNLLAVLEHQAVAVYEHDALAGALLGVLGHDDPAPG